MSSWFAMLILFAAHAGLECGKQDVLNVIKRLKSARETNCLEPKMLREISLALRELSKEPACDSSTVAAAQRSLVEARVAPLLEGNSRNCQDQLDRIEQDMRRLMKAVKGE